MQHHMKMLGLQVQDVVTGFKGVVSSVCFDLYGCVMMAVTPPVGKDGKTGESNWYDAKRLKATSQKPVMAIPTFVNEPGPAAKPPLPTSPLR